MGRKFHRNTVGRTDYTHILILAHDKEEGWFVHNPATTSTAEVTDEDGNVLKNCEWKAAAAAASRLFPDADIRLGG